jgi:hypothetical protein
MINAPAKTPRINVSGTQRRCSIAPSLAKICREKRDQAEENEYHNT